MKNLTKYNFSDFTLDNYHRLLSLAKSNYTFRLFNEEYISRSILLRHDLEFSIPIALTMAEIEAELGVKSTYFIQLHSEFYNTLEKESIKAIKQIEKSGHQLGLHFDSHFWGIENEDQLDTNIRFDKRIIEDYFDTEVKAFSFHNNTEFTLSCRKDSYGGLLNVYSDYFRTHYAYNADSLGYWRFERLEDLLNEAKEETIHILIHDGMWQEDVLPPRRRVYKVIDENSARLKKLYDDHLTKIGQKNIDWEGDINGKD
jgi:hypothetical protein